VGDHHRRALSEQGYATGTWGKWHLGSIEERFPTHQGFDEWYGIPRTYNEALWPSLNETNSPWPSVGSRQGWNAEIVPPEPVYEARKGENARQVAQLDLERHRRMDEEITSRACRIHQATGGLGEALLRLCVAEAASHAHYAASRVHR
jgi:arylsulfatase